MVYDAKNAKEKAFLPPDAILDGVIAHIQDGKVEDFVTNTENWTGDIKQPAINIAMEIKSGEETIKIEQIFTYNNNNGATTYSPNSNLGKYKKKYGKLPEPGDQVKIQTTEDGFGKIKLD